MKLLGENIHAVNIGADIFADALKAQEIETQQLNWTPPIKRTLSALQVQMMDRLADDVAQKSTKPTPRWSPTSKIPIPIGWV